jgi:hypothetical protein
MECMLNLLFRIFMTQTSVAIIENELAPFHFDISFQSLSKQISKFLFDLLEVAELDLYQISASP